MKQLSASPHGSECVPSGATFAELTSLRVGGAVDWVISPLRKNKRRRRLRMDQRVLLACPGSGSNVLADDGEHHYVILSLKELKGELTSRGTRFDQRGLFSAASLYRRRSQGLSELRVSGNSEQSVARCG